MMTSIVIFKVQISDILHTDALLTTEVINYKDMTLKKLTLQILVMVVKNIRALSTENPELDLKVFSVSSSSPYEEEQDA